MRMKNALKGTISYLIQKTSPVNQKKACFLVTRYHNNNCLVFLSYLLKNTEIEFVLLTDKPSYDRYHSEFERVPGVRVIDKEQDKFAAYKEMLTSRYVFFMHFNPYEGFIRKNHQTIINLWHGAGYKANNGDRIVFDRVLVPGPVFIESKAAFFQCDPKKVLPIGYPRYDLLKRESVRAGELRERIAGDGKKLVIWAPTYRKMLSEGSTRTETNNHDYDLPLLNSDDDLLALDALCTSSGVCILVKRHPYQERYQGEANCLKSIVFLDDNAFYEAGIDLYDFLPLTEALISDYSSVAVDYMLLDKPIAFALDDYEEYADKRGFIFRNPLDYMPGHHLYSFSDLEGFIADVAEGSDRYRSERAKLFPVMHNPCPDYCERLWETIREA